MNFYNVLFEKYKDCDKLAISCTCSDLSVKEYSYKETFSLTNHFYSLLKGAGVKEGYKVILSFPNSIEWIGIYLALAKLNATAVLLDFTLPKLEINELIKNTEPNVVITNTETMQKIEDNNVACLDAFNNLKKLNGKEVSNKIDNFLVENEISNILFSSGTTSIPSGIMQTTEHLLNTTISCLETNKIMDDKQRFLGLLPNNHIYGLLLNIYAPLICGSNVRILESLTPTALMTTFKTYKPTVLASVPKIAELLKTKISAQVVEQGKEKIFKIFLPICYNLRKNFGVNLGKKLFHTVHEGLGGCIDIFPTAGAPIAEDTAKFFLGLGFRFMSTYGSTETNIPTFGARGEDLVIDSVGKPYPNIEYKISSDGEILIKSPYCMVGYYKNEEATNSIFTPDGFVRTGDIGFIDSKNNLKITGRIKDNIILSNGKKVFPENIEKEFANIKTVAEDFAICGRQIEGLAHSEIHLFIANPTDEAKAKEMVKTINQNLPNYMQMQNVHFVNSIPKTNLDKVKRFALIKELEEHKKDEMPQKMTFDEEVIYFCLKMANLNEDYRTIPRDSRIFQDLGLDSLSTVSFLLELESKYQLDLSKAPSLPKETTIQEFLDFLKSCPKIK